MRRIRYTCAQCRAIASGCFYVTVHYPCLDEDGARDTDYIAVLCEDCALSQLLALGGEPTPDEDE